MYSAVKISKDYTDYKNPFSTLFCSTDNGLTWETVKEDMTFATEGTSFVELYNRGKVKGMKLFCVLLTKITLFDNLEQRIHE